MMKTTSSRLAIALGSTVLLATARLTVARPPAESQIDALFTSLVREDLPGAAVLVRDGGRTVFARGYGVRDLRTGTRIDATAGFRLASVSKQFTAMAAMLLVHDGKLRYDTRVTDVFPDFPAYGRAISIRHLLTHTSGLPDYEELMEAPDAQPSGPWSASRQIQDEQVLELLKRQTSGIFTPGTRWSYSNSGYVLLGLVVAKVAGEPFARCLTRRIFTPLHMNNSVVRVPGQSEPPNRAYGHSCGAGVGCQEADQSSTSATQGDGGVYSNLEDLAKWDAALERHTLLSAEEMAPALIPCMLNDGSRPTWPATPGDDNLAPGRPVSYGFGWFLDPWKGHRRMWHFGTTTGFRTAVERFPSDRLTVVVLSNRTDLDAGALALQAADLALK